jgi:uncharacterized membrane protein
MINQLKHTNIKRINAKKLLVLISFLLVVISGLPRGAEGVGASLYFSPGNGTFFVGSTFDVSIFVNTGGNNVNAVKVDLKFDPRKIQIASPTAGKSFIEVWISPPVYSNINGTASFQGGVPSPGINTSSGVVSTITFRAIAPGETIVSFLDSSKVLLDDGKGTNVLSSLGRGVYNLVIPAPEGPKVFSSTHPDQNKWYKNNNPTFSWEKEEGITDFSYSLDYDFNGTPDSISEGNNTSVSYTDLEDGIWYFHLKAKKGDIWGGITHYIVQIDTTPPADFNLVFEPTFKNQNVTSNEPIVSFITTDALSGVDHYEIKTINFTEGGEKETGFFVEVASPYKLPILNLGEHEVIVRAFDVAKNWRDVSARIEVIPFGKAFYITKKGINIFGFFLPWWQVILILVFIILFFIILVFWSWRRHRRLVKQREALSKIEERIKKNGEEIKDKLEKIT